MKNVLTLFLVLCMASLSSAGLVTMVGPEPGAPGSFENPLEESQTVRIYVTADRDVDSLIAHATLVGTGSASNGDRAVGL